VEDRSVQFATDRGEKIGGDDRRGRRGGKRRIAGGGTPIDAVNLKRADGRMTMRGSGRCPPKRPA